MTFIIRSSLAAIFMTMLVACGGGNDSPADIDMTAEQANGPKDYIAVYEKQLLIIAEAVESVADEESAQKAAAIIRDASSELEIVATKADGMSQMEKARFAMSYATNLADTQMRLMEAMTKLASTDPETVQLISDAMDELPSPVEE
ncbi:hypothetical protein FF098_013555 [Parvularcula flava]|uniref:Uncharacterized protein n=1 Tax=Aquisalinus luteolus TaxID=1566827 RepID=A0A8J3A942_9PROT|nr:hypothetical protein [Aquisalinus luteolus]NHK28943.1 hypothetical protein [Aquisalinus luteolus]GGI00785.1 hypothetical protein GCM10011355_29900 [Aquisalinus luteolus]